MHLSNVAVQAQLSKTAFSSNKKLSSHKRTQYLPHPRRRFTSPNAVQELAPLVEKARIGVKERLRAVDVN